MPLSQGQGAGAEGNFISVVNSRSAATLAAAATFQGVSEDVSQYGRVGVSIVSDNATDGTLTMEVSRDGSTWGGPTRTWADTRFAQPHMWNIVEKYFRIKYVNGSTEADNLEIQVQYSKNADILLGHQLNETLTNETEAIAVRSVAVGQDPNNTYVNEGVSGVVNDNSSTTNLTSGTSLVFTGTWCNISGYTGITVLVEGAASGTVAGTLQMQFSHDGVTAHRNIVIADTDVSNTQPRTLGVVAKYFRVIYTAASSLTAFDIQTMLHTQQVSLVSRLDQTLSGTEDVTNVRSVVAGQGVDGIYRNAGVITKDGKTSLYVVSGFTDTQTVHLDVSTTSTLIAYTLIDLSDTSNWKHTNTGEIIIEYIIIEIDPSANFVGEVKIGYLTSVDATNGNFNQLVTVDMARKADLYTESIVFGAHGMHCADEHHFGPILANNTLFQTDVNLGGPDDPTTTTYPSGNGDLVVIVDGDGTNDVGVSLTIGYETVT